MHAAALLLVLLGLLKFLALAAIANLCFLDFLPGAILWLAACRIKKVERRRIYKQWHRELRKGQKAESRPFPRLIWGLRFAARRLISPSKYPYGRHARSRPRRR